MILGSLLLMWVYAQSTEPATGGDLLELLARSYGVAAPAIVGLAYISMTFWRRLTSVQDEMTKVLNTHAEKVVPALVETTARLDENSRAMERATLIMLQLTKLDNDTLNQVLMYLNQLKAENKIGGGPNKIGGP